MRQGVVRDEPGWVLVCMGRSLGRAPLVVEDCCWIDGWALRRSEKITLVWYEFFFFLLSESPSSFCCHKTTRGGTEREEQKRKLKSTKRMTGVDEDFLGCLQIANVGWSAATAAGTGIFDDDGFGGG